MPDQAIPRSDREARIQQTPAEWQVLSFLPTHLTVEAIAGRLGRSRSTVKTHIAHLYRKLAVTGRMEAVDRAREVGLLVGQDDEQAQIAIVVSEPPRSQRSLPSRIEPATTTTKER